MSTQHILQFGELGDKNPPLPPPPPSLSLLSLPPPSLSPLYEELFVIVRAILEALSPLIATPPPPLPLSPLIAPLSPLKLFVIVRAILEALDVFGEFNLAEFGLQSDDDVEDEEKEEVSVITSASCTC